MRVKGPDRLGDTLVNFNCIIRFRVEQRRKAFLHKNVGRK